MTVRTHRRGRRLIVAVVMLVGFAGVFGFLGPGVSSAAAAPPIAPVPAAIATQLGAGTEAGAPGAAAPSDARPPATVRGAAADSGPAASTAVDPESIAGDAARPGPSANDSAEAIGAPVGMSGYAHGSRIGALSWLILGVAALLATGGVVAMVRASAVAER